MAEYIDPDTGEILDAPRDPAIAAVKEVLLDRFFRPGTEEVFYGRQLEVILEGDFFHWITKKALNELAAERRVTMVEEAAEGRAQFTAHFYAPLRYRYPRRKINEVMGLISEYSDPMFSRAVGHQGESLADAGFANIGFRILDRDVQAVDGVRWEETNHDLDRLVSRDGIRYGVEIKNQLGYIHRGEFQAKLAMCRHFGVRPLFIARMFPKSYINDIVQAGGFALVLSNQHYPLLGEDLMRRVRQRLQLPVAVIRALPDTALTRFERWHERSLDV